MLFVIVLMIILMMLTPIDANIEKPARILLGVNPYSTTAATKAPTESPAPSPNPSAMPSSQPTKTLAPSQKDSTRPTESPAPSPSPTATPSFSPSQPPSEVPTTVPSAVPTKSPSNSPSNIPTRSPSNSLSPSFSPTTSVSPTQVPSLLPSSSPTKVPSTSPSDVPSRSISPSATPTTGAPSVTPSSGPPSQTPSDIPSGAPSIFSVFLSSVIGITIDLHEILNAEELNIFEGEIKNFLESQWNSDMPIIQGILISILDVQTTEQTVIPYRGRFLKERFLHSAGLRIRVNITGEIFPGNLPEEFSFTDEVSRPFRENYATFVYNLHNLHPIFAGLIKYPENSVNAAVTDIEPPYASRFSGAAIAGIVIASIGSVVLAMFAGLYAINSKRSKSSISSKLMLDFNEIVHSDSHSTMMTPHNVEVQPLSPRGSDNSTVLKPNIRSLLDKINMRNDSDDSDSSKDSDVDIGFKASKAILGVHALKDSNKSIVSSRGSDPPEGLWKSLGAYPSIKTNLSSLCYSEDSTSSQGTPRSATQSPTVYDTPSSIQSGGGHLGARPMEALEKIQFRKESGSITSSILDAPSVRRTGLFDVFAPSGPLGIVVDTTRDGPVVHSLKSTSPLLGLVSPGDLIVGLDDMDTRSMTAATLTRLMAKRSHQAERKITLLACEGESLLP